MGVLDGKVAIVTGSARGIGRATAEMLSEHGASVVINDLDGDVARADGGRDRRRDRGLRRRPDRRRRPRQARPDGDRRFGRIDIIVNNAGYTLDAPIHKMSDDWCQRMLDIHVTAPFKVIRAAAPHLREPAKAGARRGPRGLPQDRQRLLDLGHDGQRRPGQLLGRQVGGRRPDEDAGQGVGPVQGQLQRRRLRLHRDAPDRLQGRRRTSMEIGGEKVQLGIPDQLRGMASMLIPLGRPGTPEEAAGGVFFLCSPWSNYVHGQVLNVTGGQFTGMTTVSRAAARRDDRRRRRGRSRRPAAADARLLRLLRGRAERRGPARAQPGADRRPRARGRPADRARRRRPRGRLRDDLLDAGRRSTPRGSAS